MKLRYFLSCTSMTLASAVFMPVMAESQPAAAKHVPIYIGTYTQGSSKGVYRTVLDTSTGQLSQPQLVAETPSPSFLALHPNRKSLFAANEVDEFQGKPTGSLTSFAIDAKGGLKQLSVMPSGGGGPCHLAVDPSGKVLAAANYGGGSAIMLPVKADGRMGEPTDFSQHKGSSANKSRQEGPHAHCVTYSPDGKFVFITDLGLDKIMIYGVDAKEGKLVENEVQSFSLKAGSGPRHLAFHPNGRHAFVINELSSTLTALSYDKNRGTFAEVQTLSTLPADFKGQSSTAEVVVHPNGKFVYGSNRGHDSIAIFAVDPKKGTLVAAGHQSTLGKVPRSFSIDPTGNWLVAANQGTENLSVFKIDPATGGLTPTGQGVQVGSPVCVLFAP